MSRCNVPLESLGLSNTSLFRLLIILFDFLNAYNITTRRFTILLFSRSFSEGVNGGAHRPKFSDQSPILAGHCPLSRRYMNSVQNEQTSDV